MAGETDSPSSENTDSGGDARPRDPGQIPIEERWAPISGRRPTREMPASFRARWLAAVLCLILIFGVIALLG